MNEPESFGVFYVSYSFFYRFQKQQILFIFMWPNPKKEKTNIYIYMTINILYIYIYMSLCLKQDKSTGISSYGLYRGNLRWIPQITRFHSSYLFQTKKISIDAKLQKGSRSSSIPYTPIYSLYIPSWQIA